VIGVGLGLHVVELVVAACNQFVVELVVVASWQLPVGVELLELEG